MASPAPSGQAAHDVFGCGDVISAPWALAQLMRNWRMSASELRSLQDARLRAVFRHACETVPYYRSLFASAGLRPEDVRTVEDLACVPITTKADLKRAGLQATIASGTDISSCRKASTSGTTGDRFDVYLSPSEHALRRLVRFRAYQAMGLRPLDRLCVLGPGDPDRPAERGFFGLYRRHLISVLLPVDEQLRLLQQAHATVLRVWPTVFRSLLQHVDFRLDSMPRPRALIHTSEVLEPSLRQRVAAHWDVDWFNFYAATEFDEIASECRTHQGLHVQADQLILECLREDGHPAGPGQPGSVIITSLVADTMPFIRYRLGDTGSVTDKPCSCGCSFPLIDAPLGRQEDVVRLPSGDVRSVLGMGTIVEDAEGIDQYRFIQESRNHLVVQLVLWRKVEEEALQALGARIRQYLGEPVRVDVQLVDRLAEPNLKFRKFISKVPQDHEPDG